MNKSLISDPKAWCDCIAAHHKRQIKEPDIVSAAMLISRHGIMYPPKFGRCEAGPVKNCYGNAAQLAIADSDMTYVEGWATSDVGLSVEHAWCVKRGRVYEPTWTGRRDRPGRFARPYGVAYYGMPVPAELLIKVMQLTKTQSVFAQWHNWDRILPLLRREMPEWFEKKKNDIHTGVR